MWCLLPSQFQMARLPPAIHVIWAAALNNIAVLLLRPLRISSVCPEGENASSEFHTSNTFCILLLKLKETSWDTAIQTLQPTEFLFIVLFYCLRYAHILKYLPSCHIRYSDCSERKWAINFPQNFVLDIQISWWLVTIKLPDSFHLIFLVYGKRWSVFWTLFWSTVWNVAVLFE